MMKKSLIAIALMAFLATTVQAGDAAQNPWKFDDPTEVYWPWEYKALEICQVPVYMEVGMYVEMTNCTGRNSAKIELKQVTCDDLKSTPIDEPRGGFGFPCYFDCTNISIRANFDVKLGYKLYKIGNVLDGWDAYYDGIDVIPGDGATHTTSLCVGAWSADIFNHAPGDEVLVGEVAVTVKPNA
jgi:hypothetical protein